MFRFKILLLCALPSIFYNLLLPFLLSSSRNDVSSRLVYLSINSRIQFLSFLILLQARRTYKIDFADLHSTFKDQHYDWLPGPNEIPKELGENLNQEYLDRLEVCTENDLSFFLLLLFFFFFSSYVYLNRRVIAITRKKRTRTRDLSRKWSTLSINVACTLVQILFLVR